jgi:hypothetical protein
VGGLNRKGEKEGGFGQNSPFFFLPSPGTEEGHGRGWQPSALGPGCLAAAEERGKSTRGSRGFDSPTHHGLRRSGEAALRGRAEVAGGGSGGGAVGVGRE